MEAFIIFGAVLIGILVLEGTYDQGFRDGRIVEKNESEEKYRNESKYEENEEEIDE